MKRLLGLLLLIVLLWGCSAKETPQEAPTEPATQAQTDPGTYDPQNPIESQTGGAVMAYKPDMTNCTGMLTMGEALLVFRGENPTLLTHQQLTEFTTVELPGLPSPDSGLVQAHDDSVAYYNEKEKSIVFLGKNLRETARLQLQDDVVGGVYLSPDWKMAYYCTAEEVCALDMQTGISRLLKEHGGAKKTVTGVFLNGRALRCTSMQEDGTEKTVLLSTETGEQIYEGDHLASLATGEDWYFLQMQDCSVPEWLIGKDRGDATCLWPVGDPVEHWVLPGCDGVLTLCRQDGALVLDQYMFETGLRTASVRLEGLSEIHDLSVSSKGEVFFCSGESVYRWMPEKSPVEDETVYTMPRFNPNRPDEAGIAAAQTAAKALEKRYKVELLLYSEADSVAPWDYRFETEYIGKAYEKAIGQLDKIMAQFPEGFFATAAEKSANKKLTIVLVRGIYGAPESGTLESAPGVQYWLDGKAYIALTMGETLERYFYHEMGHVIDTVVLSKTKYFYEWEKWNPAGFKYDNDYTANLDRKDDQYLKAADRWFIDMYSMSFAVEDRSRIFEYASLPGNEAYFTSPHMQKKLQQICTGIRRAFGLRKDPNTFLWEQYLQK